MTIGAGTFEPGARFALPRSYVYDFVIYRAGNSVIQMANNFLIQAPPPSPSIAFVSILPAFWPWSSNGYTLDFLVVESWYKPTGTGTELPLPFEIRYKVLPLTNKPAIYYGFFGLETDPEVFPLAPAPPGYWLPKPLP